MSDEESTGIEYSDEEIQDYVDEAEDDMEDSGDMKDAQMDSMAETYPSQTQKQDIYNWFWKVTRLKKPFQLVKVGNLTSQEIGVNKVSIRDALNLWNLGHTFGHPTFGNYFATNAKITSASSMSKKGWFMELSISQRKVRERARQSGDESWKIYKKKNRNQEPA